MPVPTPTPILRLIHIDNLHIYLKRGKIHAPNCTPDDGLIYRTIHDTEVQQKRYLTEIPCGPGGVIHDYVPFYFGYLSPMMLKLKTGQVAGYHEGQEPLIYLVSTVQKIQKDGIPFVFSDGHGLARFSQWFDNISDLCKIDWTVVYQRYWSDDLSNMDRQRRKQAEFLIYRSCSWSLIEKIAVIDKNMESKVRKIMNGFLDSMSCPVEIKRNWYYY